MKNFIEGLYYDNIDPQNSGFEGDESVQRKLRTVSESEDWLTERVGGNSDMTHGTVFLKLLEELLPTHADRNNLVQKHARSPAVLLQTHCIVYRNVIYYQKMFPVRGGYCCASFGISAGFCHRGGVGQKA